MVLIKLRLDVPLHDLDYRFNFSVPTVSRTFQSWLMTMDICPLAWSWKSYRHNATLLHVQLWNKDYYNNWLKNPLIYFLEHKHSVPTSNTTLSRCWLASPHKVLFPMFLRHGLVELQTSFWLKSVGYWVSWFRGHGDGRSWLHYFWVLPSRDSFYKLRQLFYYKLRHSLLQIATGITKCDDYYKLRQKWHHFSV